MNSFIRLFVCMLAYVVQLVSSCAGDWYVDNVKGDDTWDGSSDKPFKTISRAFKSAKTSDGVYLSPNAVPYSEKIEILAVGGTAEKSFVLDGRGSVINRLTHYTADKWKDEGGSVFSMPLPNNAHVMDRQGYWSDFPIVFLDGQPSKFVKAKSELAENTYLLYKQAKQKGEKDYSPLHNTLYVKLASGKTPADVKIECPGIGTNCSFGTSFVTIKNLTSMYSSIDGLNVHGRASGVVFENVRGAWNMDQGISSHGAEVTVKNSRFDHNAGCGIVDVFPECRAKYIDCMVEDNAPRGGIEFHSGEYEMENCVVRNNGLVVINNAKLKLSNCLFVACGIVDGGSMLIMKNCTVFNAKEGLSIWLGDKESRVDVLNCAFISNQMNYSWRNPKKEGIATLNFDYNYLTPAPLKAYGKIYKPEQWNEFQKETKLESHSLMKNYEGECPPYKMGLEIEGRKIGAELPHL